MLLHDQLVLLSVILSRFSPQGTDEELIESTQHYPD